MLSIDSPMVYELVQPAQADPNKSYPALFLMHGMGSNEQDLLPLVDKLRDQFFIFSIRGPIQQPPGYAFFTIEGFGKPHREVFDTGVQKVTSFLDYTTEKYPIDPNQFFLLGFSQGAILSMSLGLKIGNRIKGIVALSGYIPKFVREEYEKQAVEQLSLFISHGEMDPILPFEWGVEASDYFQSFGADVTFIKYAAGHTVSLQNHKDMLNWLESKV